MIGVLYKGGGVLCKEGTMLNEIKKDGINDHSNRSVQMRFRFLVASIIE
jgi:hypothetical protein